MPDVQIYLLTGQTRKQEGLPITIVMFRPLIDMISFYSLKLTVRI